MKQDIMICLLVCVIVPLIVALFFSDKAPGEAQSLARSIQTAFSDHIDKIHANMTSPRIERLKRQAARHFEAWVRDAKSLLNEYRSQPEEAAKPQQDHKAAEEPKPTSSSVVADARPAG